MSKESLLKKEFRERDVNRVRNIVRKNLSAKTISGIGYTEKQEKHKEGDVWEEDGRTWTIKNGVKQNVSKLDLIKKAVQTPLTCPRCIGPMNHHLHKKMYKVHGVCFDCTVDYEAQLRKVGLYESYEKALVQGSLKAWGRDLQAYVEDYLQETTTYLTEQGDIEDWVGNISSHRTQILNNLKEYLTHIDRVVK